MGTSWRATAAAATGSFSRRSRAQPATASSRAPRRAASYARDMELLQDSIDLRLQPAQRLLQPLAQGLIAGPHAQSGGEGEGEPPVLARLDRGQPERPAPGEVAGPRPPDHRQ